MRTKALALHDFFGISESDLHDFPVPGSFRIFNIKILVVKL